MKLHLAGAPEDGSVGGSTTNLDQVAAKSQAEPAHSTMRRCISWQSRIGGIAVICCYVAWAFFIPIKNVVMIKNPTLRVDSVATETSAYAFNNLSTSSSLRKIAGQEIVPLLQQIVNIAVGIRAVREQLESVGSFDIDTIHSLLGPEDFQTIALYYALVVQATEFPGSVFTPRPRHFLDSSSGSSLLPNDAVGLWVMPTNGSDPWLLSVSCAAENAFMDGTKCFQNNTDYVCYDFPAVGDKRSHVPTSLDGSRISSGLANNVGLLAKSWNKTLDALQFSNDEMALNNGFSSVFREDGVPVIREKFAMSTYSLQLADLTTKTLESCFFTEIITHVSSTRAFVFDLIETALIGIPTQPYGAHASTRLSIPRDRLNALVTPLFAQSLTISSGASPNTGIAREGTTVLNGVQLTSIARATARLKLDKKLQSVDGSSVRMLLLMAQYPDFYSIYDHRVLVDSESSQAYDTMAFSLIGGAMSGMNSIKRSWWGNTPAVYKLAEIPKGPNDTRTDSWWDEETKMAAWFQRLESTDNAPYFTLAKYIDIEAPGVVLDDNSLTPCHRAFYKAMAKIAWLSLLTSSAQPQYLVFMANLNGGARTWFMSAVKRWQLYGEAMDGTRIGFPFSSSSNNRQDDASAWVFVPMLQAMLDNFGQTQTIHMILTEYNASFSSLVSTEYGLVHFTDSPQCKVGFQTNNVTAETNTMQKITTKFYPSVKAFVENIVQDHASLYTKMKTELALQGVEMTTIPKEMLVGSPSAPNDIGYVGSPVFWRPTAFSVGMLKFWPGASPPSSVIQAYRNATVCYRTLELRYLNESIRCWVEPNSVTRSRTAYNSENLRFLIWSNWSVSWVLNTIAIFIAIRFFRRFVAAYKATQFRCVSFWVATQFNFQSVGVLTFSQVVLMTISAVPLLVALHLPMDPVFMEPNGAAQYSKPIRELFVTLSATWFVRLGYDSVNICVVSREPIPRFYSFHLRAAAQLLILGIRFLVPDDLDNAAYEMWKMMGTCALSIALGGLCPLFPVLLLRHGSKITPRAVASPSPSPPILLLKAHSVIVRKLKDEGMPLNHHGLLGFSRYYGWSVTGLVVEGWEVIERKHKNQVIVARGQCRVHLEVDKDGKIQCVL